jgi:bifunctional DNase/RNase
MDMTKDFVEVRVHGVAVDDGEGMPVVLLLDKDEGAGIPLSVGPFEASAIIIELQGISPPRPLTHDLLAELFRESGLILERAELYGAAEVGPQARLIYRRGLIQRRKEVRPSDAVALALRLKAPICAQRSLLETRARAELSMGDFPSDRGGHYLRTESRAI